MLKPSKQDMIHLCARAVPDYNDLLQLHRRVRGTDMIVTKTFGATVQLVTRLFQRYESGDFRHREREKAALIDLCQFNLATNAELRNQPTPSCDFSRL